MYLIDFNIKTTESTKHTNEDTAQVSSMISFGQEQRVQRYQQFLCSRVHSPISNQLEEISSLHTIATASKSPTIIIFDTVRILATLST